MPKQPQGPESPSPVSFHSLLYLWIITIRSHVPVGMSHLGHSSCALLLIERIIRYEGRGGTVSSLVGNVSLPCSHSLVKGVLVMLGTILWVIVVVLVVLWLLGWLAFHIGGTFIHILIVVAVIVLLYNLFVGRRRRSL